MRSPRDGSWFFARQRILEKRILDERILDEGGPEALHASGPPYVAGAGRGVSADPRAVVQASRRTNSQPPTPSASAAYPQRIANPTQGLKEGPLPSACVTVVIVSLM